VLRPGHAAATAIADTLDIESDNFAWHHNRAACTELVGGDPARRAAAQTPQLH